MPFVRASLHGLPADLLSVKEARNDYAITRTLCRSSTDYAHAQPRTEVLTAFGAAAVTIMMICYGLESHNKAWTFVFAAACFASSIYGWLAGTWPFGVVEAIWGVVALEKGRRRVFSRS
jgi:hypothetical protein